ncbi:MAG: hypothetical protein M1838_000012 [Thelocarpon superellum]|nr:MAG: hypothetical protein M1838_000012 [Thelocarpon superellum]
MTLSTTWEIRNIMRADTYSMSAQVQPTPKEAFFMLHVLNNQEGKPKVNWSKVAEAVGLKNGATASVRFGQIKKRLGWTDPSSSAATAPSTPVSTTAPRKTIGSGTNLSPSKVTKPRGKNAAKAKMSQTVVQHGSDVADVLNGGGDTRHNAVVLYSNADHDMGLNGDDDDADEDEK